MMKTFLKEKDAAEMLGSQSGVAKMLCDLKFTTSFLNLYRKLLCPRNFQVTNLNVNLYLTVEEEKISEVRFGDVSEVSFRSPGNQLVQEQHNYGGLKHGE